MHRWLRGFLRRVVPVMPVLVLVVYAYGCGGGSEGGDSGCTGGAVAVCSCEDGSAGRAVCQEGGGSLGPCSCEAGAPTDGGVFIYVVSMGDDAADVYREPTDLAPVVRRLAEADFVPVVHDETTLSTLESSEVSSYEQVWVLEVDRDRQTDLTESEVGVLRDVVDDGGGIWVSGETDPLAEDANEVMAEFNVESTESCQGTEEAKFIGSGHPALDGVSTLKFDDSFGGLTVSDPSVDVLWNSEGGCAGLAALSREGAGRAFFDAGWVLTYAYLEDNQGNRDVTVSVARWLGP